MKITHLGIRLTLTESAVLEGGSFATIAGRYNGAWYEAPAIDDAGKEYRVIYTDVNWETINEDERVNWENPDYVLPA